MYELWDQMAGFFRQGGIVMPPLVLGAALLWYGLGYRALALRRRGKRSVRQLVADYRQELPSSGRVADVVEKAASRGVEISRSNVDNLRRHLDVAFHEQEQEIGKYAVLVTAIVIVAPLTGLLGTVSGMIETFDSLGDMALFSQSGGVAGGISEALFSTQMGLAVAIPGLLVGRVLSRKQARLQGELDQLKNLLCSGVAA